MSKQENDLTMNNLFNLRGNRSFLALSLILLTSLSACSVVDLENGTQNTVESPVGLPATAAELNDALVGDGSRIWSAKSFNLEGMVGVQACRLDDTFRFFADGTYRYDGGETLCGGEDSQRIRTGTWQMDFDELTITFDVTTNLQSEAKLIGLSDDTMELSGTVTVFGENLDIRGIYQYIAEQ
ncbi:lipocalin family protein [Roseivirga sp.]|uniref:lipocalin family protein n=1 Tax=Roseivirga sp. TaxID=1964215 RepID=UPI003B51CACE